MIRFGNILYLKVEETQTIVPPDGIITAVKAIIFQCIFNFFDCLFWRRAI